MDKKMQFKTQEMLLAGHWCPEGWLQVAEHVLGQSRARRAVTSKAVTFWTRCAASLAMACGNPALGKARLVGFCTGSPFMVPRG